VRACTKRAATLANAVQMRGTAANTQACATYPPTRIALKGIQKDNRRADAAIQMRRRFEKNKARGNKADRY
jgi:hypothetical protein